MSSSEDSNQQSSPLSPEDKTSSQPWRKRRIFAGILTIYIGYESAMSFVLADTIRQSYGFLAGAMSGLGSSGIGITVSFPAIITFLVFMIGGLMFCGKKGRGRFVVWLAAFVSVPVVLWTTYLITIIPGRRPPDPSFIPIFINLAISIYLIWVLWKTSQNEESLQSRIRNMFTPKKLGVATLIASFFVVWVYSGKISYEYSKKYWEPSDQIAGLRIGTSKEQFKKIKGKFYGCHNNICSWHYRSNKRPDLLVYLEDEKAVKIHTISPRVTGDKVPFDTVEQMHEILGQEDIRAEGYPDIIYTYTKWNISYEWANDVLTGISLGAYDWPLKARGARYYIKGRQVCPSQACPWDVDDKLKAEYENVSYRDFLSPSPELEKMLDEAKEFENERNRIQDEETNIRLYAERAEQGEALAQYRLGAMYYRAGKDYGATQEYPKAEKWIRLAAEQGYNEAQYNLGKMYEEGLGLAQDFEEALKWYGLAAEERFQPAMSSLGSMYMNGTGVPQNNIIAYKWFHLSAMGDNQALANRDALDKTMTEDEKLKAKEKAGEWYKAYMLKVELRRQKRQ